jgi:hypothetical protein
VVTIGWKQNPRGANLQNWKSKIEARIYEDVTERRKFRLELKVPVLELTKEKC